MVKDNTINKVTFDLSSEFPRKTSHTKTRRRKESFRMKKVAAKALRAVSLMSGMDRESGPRQGQARPK